MSQSLSEGCTPLKTAYDACFNSWFEGYLEPAVSASVTSEQRTKFSQDKAAEFERSCGKIWRQYKECVEKAITDRGLEDLLNQARAENPLKDPPAPAKDSK